MLAEHSYPFDSSSLNEAQWSRMAGSWQDNGVDASGPWDQALKVLSTGQPFQLLVTAGHAKVAGFHYELDANAVILFAENKTTSQRTDRVVLKLDRESNTVVLGVKQGGATAPPVDRSWDALEIPLATFVVRANSDTVTPADLADVREFVSSGVQMLSPANGTTGARSLTEGQIGYSPTVGKFYARDGSKSFELGAPPDLSPYLTKTSAASTYSPVGHTHTVSAVSLNFTWQSGGTAKFASAYRRLGVVYFSFSLERTASDTLPSGGKLGSIVATPYTVTLFNAYVHSGDFSSLTKAGAVYLSTSGELFTYNTFWGPSETLIASGSFLLSPGTITASGIG